MKKYNVTVSGNVTVEADTAEIAIRMVQETLLGNEAIGVDPRDILGSIAIEQGSVYEL
jgi:hypothetical protein